MYDEFGRSRPPPRSRSRSDSRTSSREREARHEARKQERKERKKEKRLAGREGGGAVDDETAEERAAREKEDKKSLWPPGSDLSLYTFDPQLYWCAQINQTTAHRIFTRDRYSVSLSAAALHLQCRVPGPWRVVSAGAPALCHRSATALVN